MILLIDYANNIYEPKNKISHSKFTQQLFLRWTEIPIKLNLSKRDFSENAY